MGWVTAFDQTMRNRWRNLSLRARLTALSVGLLAALLGGLGAALYAGLRQFLLHSTAVRIRAQAKPVIERQIGQLSDLPARASVLARSLTSRDTTATVFDRQGRILANGRRLSEEPVPMPPMPGYVTRASAGEKDLTYIAAQAGQRALVALIPLRPAPASANILGVVQLTTRLTQVDQILSRQRRMLGLGILVP